MTVEIGGTVYTGYVQQDTYSVTHEASYTEWKDANYRTHRDYGAPVLGGTFELGFASLNDEAYQALIQAIKNTEQDHKVYCNLYAQNTGKQVKRWVYYSLSVVSQKRLPNGYVVTKVKVKVQE